MPLTRRSALALLAVGPLTGCSFTPITWEESTATPSADETADDAVVVAEDYFNRSPGSAPKTLTEGTSTLQRISTPHFDARLDRRFVGARLDANTSAQVYEPGAVQAPDGFELIAFTLQAGRPFYTSTAGSGAEIDIVVGGETWLPLTAPFGAFNQTTRSFEREWVLGVFAVPRGADAVLQVSDEGRSVRVDLRTGAPSLDDGWASTQGFREPVTVAVTGEQQVLTRQLVTTPTDATPAQTSTFKFGIAPEASRGLVPWNPEDGWADDGMQWLRMETGARVQFEPAGDPTVVMDIDVVRSFLYRDGTAAPLGASRPTSITTEVIANGSASLDVTWMVPSPKGHATFTCDPVGPILAQYRDHAPIPMKVTSTPNQLVFTVSFTPAEEPW